MSITIQRHTNKLFN